MDNTVFEGAQQSIKGKKIGIFLGVGPGAGGSFQYNQSILSAAESLARDGANIQIFYQESFWRPYIGSFADSLICGRGLLSKLLFRFARKIKLNSEAMVRLAPVFFPVLDRINRSECDIMIFPGQDWVAGACRKKFLVTIHDLMHRYETNFLEYAGDEIEFRDQHYQRLCNRAAGILVDSALGKRHVEESYRCPADRVFVLPFVPPPGLTNAVHSTVDVRKEFGLPERFIFYPAQFWEHKNHINLLKAIALLREAGTLVPLILVGGRKANFPKVVREIEDGSLTELVRILGYVDETTIIALYREAEMLVYPSLLGPTNIPPLEAMSLGCPVVCSRVYAMEEQLGDAAMFFDPRDPNSIAMAIKEVWDSEAKRAEMVHRGRRRVQSWGQKEFNAALRNIIVRTIDR